MEEQEGKDNKVEKNVISHTKNTLNTVVCYVQQNHMATGADHHFEKVRKYNR